MMLILCIIFGWWLGLKIVSHIKAFVFQTFKPRTAADVHEISKKKFKFSRFSQNPLSFRILIVTNEFLITGNNAKIVFLR